MANSGSGPARVAVVAATIPQADFGVAPAELGDSDVWARLRHRVRVVRTTSAAFALGGGRINERDAPTTNVSQPTYPVVGESGDQIRVAMFDDSAALALWIPRRDAAPTALVPVRLGDDHGTADPISGVTLGAGMPVTADPPANGLRKVRLVDEFLDATGYAPASAIGEVWLAGEHEPYNPATINDGVPPPNATGHDLLPGPIREAPRDDAPTVATAKLALAVRIVRTIGAWDEIEIHATRVRVHGFVPVAAVTDQPQPNSYTSFGHGRSYAITDTARIDVPVAVCLYDRAGGEVIGVETAAKQRYSQGTSMPGWWSVVVGTEWGLLDVVVHDVSQATDPKAASWETCKK